MHPVAGDTPAFEKGRHQKMRIEGAKFLGDHIRLHRIMTTQGGIGTADHHRTDRLPRVRQPMQRFAQIDADLAGDGGGLGGAHAARIAEDKKSGESSVSASPSVSTSQRVSSRQP